jgi:hypothetical protein
VPTISLGSAYLNNASHCEKNGEHQNHAIPTLLQGQWNTFLEIAKRRHIIINDVAHKDPGGEY